MDKIMAPEMEDRNASEIYQLRGRIAEKVMTAVEGQPPSEMDAAGLAKRLKKKLDAIYICYAHQQHLFRGSDITNPDKRTKAGFAPQFEMVTKFPGRMAKAACSPDLYGRLRYHGKPHARKPRLNLLPRVFFVSDMADAPSEGIVFAYLEHEIIAVVGSNRGQQHLWLWLTKKPERMAEFAQWVQKRRKIWPDNLVAMTSVTGANTHHRAKKLRTVPARFRGLSVEPLWGEVELPLEGIDWCIVGGQSGPGSTPFDLSWARRIQKQCKKAGTAFSVKQLGARPVDRGRELTLKDKHGRDWHEWPADLRVREMPPGFYDLRVEAMGKA